jgi:hypothetical protein
MSACVPYYPIDLEVDTNTPPVIVTDGVEPVVTQEAIFVDIGEGCGATTFLAPVVDYDGAETLFFKWIITATLDSASSEVVSQRELIDSSIATVEDPDLVETILGEGASAAAPGARVVAPGIRLELNSELIGLRFDFPDSLVGNDKTHLLELYVSDRPFQEGVNNVEPKPNAGEPRQFPAHAAWVLTVISTEDC